MAPRSSVARDRAGDGSREGKYLTFRLGEEEFGLGILKVKEIIGMMAFTPIPRTPDFVKGVINLRGRVIPVVDLRLKFGLEPIPYDERTCIVVAQVSGGAAAASIGLVVDAVNEVANVKAEEIEDTPNFGVSLDTTYILGMAKTGEAVRILLDIDRVLVGEELEMLGHAA